MKFDLVGTGSGGPYTTVNLSGDPDLRCDILLVDRYVPLDGTVEEFRLSHTLKHVPSEQHVEFLLVLRRKLRVGGVLTVIQTDAGAVLEQYHRGEVSFRAMRSTLFPPADRMRANPLNRHQQMWSEAELVRDLEALGFETEGFEAGTWALDTEDELCPEEMVPYRGVPIRNLGVRATARHSTRHPPDLEDDRHSGGDLPVRMDRHLARTGGFRIPPVGPRGQPRTRGRALPLVPGDL